MTARRRPRGFARNLSRAIFAGIDHIPRGHIFRRITAQKVWLARKGVRVT